MEFISWLMISIVLVLLPLSQSQSDTTFFNYTFNFNRGDPNLIFQGDAHVHPNQGWDVAELTAADYNHLGLPIPFPLPNSVGRVVYSRPIRLWDRAGRRQANFQTHFKCMLWNFWSADVLGDGISFFIAPVNTTIPAGGHMGIYNSSGSSPTPVFAVELDSFSNSWDPPYRHVGININSRRSVAVERWESIGNTDFAEVTITYDASARLITVDVAYPGGPVNVTVQHVYDLKTLLPEWVQIGFSASTANTVASMHEIRKWSFISFLLPEASMQQQTINDSLIGRS